MHLFNQIWQTAVTDHSRLPAIIAGESMFSYSAIDREVKLMTTRLQASGIFSGSCLSVIPHNNWESLVLLLALFHQRVTVALLSPRLPPTAVAECMAQIGSHTVISAANDLQRSPNQNLTILSRQEFFRAGREVSCSEGKPDRDHPVSDSQSDTGGVIIFTSGSTRQPKAVYHRLEQHCIAGMNANQHLPLSPGDRWLLSVPLHHVSGLAVCFRCLAAGATMVIPPDPGLHPAQFSQYGITHCSLVPTQLHRLLRAPEIRSHVHRLRAMLVGGGPLAKSLGRQGQRLGLPLFPTYGATEMASQITTVPVGAPAEKSLTAGKAIPGCVIKITGDGEILVRGPTLFAGYVRQGRIVPAMDTDGWFHTGDLGILDHDGYLSLIGRKDNMFISGGENIHPEEIEECLKAIPRVIDAVVVPVPHPEFGWRPVAFVGVVDPADRSPLRLIEALSSVLPAFKIPQAFHGWPESFPCPLETKIDRQHWKELADH